MVWCSKNWHNYCLKLKFTFKKKMSNLLLLKSRCKIIHVCLKKGSYRLNVEVVVTFAVMFLNSNLTEILMLPRRAVMQCVSSMQHLLPGTYLNMDGKRDNHQLHFLFAFEWSGLIHTQLTITFMSCIHT